MNVPVLDLYKKVPIWQFASVECSTEYFYLYDQKKHLIDPNVLRRIERANEVMAVEYNLLQKIRADLIEEFNKFFKETSKTCYCYWFLFLFIVIYWSLLCFICEIVYSNLGGRLGCNLHCNITFIWYSVNFYWTFRRIYRKYIF